MRTVLYLKLMDKFKMRKFIECLHEFDVKHSSFRCLCGAYVVRSYLSRREETYALDETKPCCLIEKGLFNFEFPCISFVKMISNISIYNRGK